MGTRSNEGKLSPPVESTLLEGKQGFKIMTVTILLMRGYRSQPDLSCSLGYISHSLNGVSELIHHTEEGSADTPYTQYGARRGWKALDAHGGLLLNHSVVTNFPVWLISCKKVFFFFRIKV